ncbi:MAG: glutamate--tRNA ligase [Acidimicrobiales bacterium]|nr:glutamate--tRNA ligase [Acidimicrobiales bacterium]
MTEPAPRVRFAPSPTGYLHVGGARSALFNWLFARRTGGTFLLRIEDTDVERSQAELTEGILRSLEWLGIDWDEGPYFQSERFDRYRDAAARLLADGRAYLVDADDRPVPGGALADGLAVRFRTPDTGTTEFEDLIRGHVRFENADLEDFVIWRSNGTPMFLLANAVDDADMRITHAVRGEDLLSSAPKVLLLMDALGHQDRPAYAHLPLLVNAQRQKLSKRRDDVAVEDYRARGYLPEALRNYLALLGWGPADGVEIRPIEEIVERFRLEDVTKSAAFFDHKKLDHVDAEYIRALPVAEFVERCQPWLAPGRAPWPPEAFDPDAFAVLAPLVQERVRTLGEVPDWVGFVFADEPPVDEAAWDKAITRNSQAASILDDAMAAFEGCEWTAPALHQALLGVADAHGLKLGKAQAPVRVAVTGRSVGPPLFESLAVLGRERTLARLRAARSRR